MRKNHYLFIAAACLLSISKLNAQGWAKTVHAGGATNVYQNFTFDNNGNPVIIGGAEEFSGGATDGMVFMKLNKETGTRSLIKKYNGKTNSESYKIFRDDQGNVYYFGTFTDRIAFGNDTMFTYDRINWNSPNLILVKFDSEGNHIWSKKFGKKFGVELQQVVDAHVLNDEFFAMVNFGGDSVFYNDSLVKKLTAGSFANNSCVFRIGLSDGSLKKFTEAGTYFNYYPMMFSVTSSGNYEYGKMDVAMTKKFIVYSLTESASPLVKCSTEIKDMTNGSGYDIENAVLHNGNYYLLAVNNQTASGWSIYGGDTVKLLPSPYNLRGAALLKFDASFNLKKQFRFQWREDYPKLIVSGNKLVVPTRFSNTLYMESDSVICSNNQQAWEVMGFNEELVLTDTMQVNTANSSGGSFDLAHAAYDNDGNLYGQVVHNKNILFYGTVVTAALKSWDHLTVLVRKGDNLGSGVNDNKLSTATTVYPNPSTNAITINVKVNEMSIKDISGQTVLNTIGQTIDISSLIPGVYFIQASDGVNLYHTKFVKN